MKKEKHSLLTTVTFVAYRTVKTISFENRPNRRPVEGYLAGAYGRVAIEEDVYKPRGDFWLHFFRWAAGLVRGLTSYVRSSSLWGKYGGANPPRESIKQVTGMLFSWSPSVNRSWISPI